MARLQTITFDFTALQGVDLRPLARSRSSIGQPNKCGPITGPALRSALDLAAGADPAGEWLRVASDVETGKASIVTRAPASTPKVASPATKTIAITASLTTAAVVMVSTSTGPYGQFNPRENGMITGFSAGATIGVGVTAAINVICGFGPVSVLTGPGYTVEITIGPGKVFFGGGGIILNPAFEIVGAYLTGGGGLSIPISPVSLTVAYGYTASSKISAHIT